MTDKPSLMPTYKRSDTAFEQGQGSWLYDTDGNKYLDLVSGLAVCVLGHCHPAVTQAIRDQAGRLIHTSNMYTIPLQAKLAELLTQVSDMESVFLCNSGAEANEAAIKIARLHGHNRGIDTPAIVVMDKSFHGRTLATLSATGNRKVQAGFEPLVSGFIRAPFDDIEALTAIARNNTNVVAVLVEPIQGEGGINVAADDYLQKLREVCDQNDWLMMLDEVQTGNGRTGKYFAYQHSSIMPDVVTTAKGLGNGFPIGACLARGVAATVLQPGNHASTFGGNPLACAAAIATIETIVENNIAAHAAQIGAEMLASLRDQLRHADYIKDIRGQGLMIGIEFDKPCSELVLLAKAKGLLINVTEESIIRMLPPLILTSEEAAMAVDAVVKLIKVYAGDDRGKERRRIPRTGGDRRKILNET